MLIVGRELVEELGPEARLTLQPSAIAAAAIATTASVRCLTNIESDDTRRRRDHPRPGGLLRPQ
jgi:hypothetical protein